MSELSDVNAFIRASREISREPDLARLLSDMTLEIGFDYFSLLQIDFAPGRGPVERIRISTYPESWIERIIERRYYADDPAYLASCRTAVGFRLSEVGRLISMTAKHRRILEEAKRAGIGDGFTVPAHIPGESNGISAFMVRPGRELPEERLPMAQLVGSFSFEAARRLRMKRETEQWAPVQLTPRQLDCVLQVARGKTDWEIGVLLGIHEETVTEYLDDARRRYDVSRRAQLVVRALYDGHFTIADALG